MNSLHSQQASEASFPRHVYSGQLLAVLAIGYILSMLFIFGDPNVWRAASETSTSSSSSFGVIGSIGVMIFLFVVVTVLIKDWRGFTTLNGFVKWKRMKVWQRCIVGYFFIGFSMFLLGIYFVQAYQVYRQDRQQEPLRRQRKIAELEAQLGMMPQTHGTCRVCHKPLQLGAEFCSYCGADVVEKPRICPNCATTTLPDAKWCPKCRTPLSTTN